MKTQNESGYTTVPNKLVDAIIAFQCTSLKQEILMFMIRHTFGYHRESITATAVYIADQICRNRIKTSVALRELIQSNVIIEVTGERGSRSRSFSINMNTMQWHSRPLTELPEMSDENSNAEVLETPGTVSQAGNREISQKKNSLSQTGSREISQKETALSQAGKTELTDLGMFEISQMDTPLSGLGYFKHSLQGSFEISQMGYTLKSAYIDGKNENSGSKENIKENKRNIYMYDITLIPPVLAGRSGFKEAFNDWCIYRQEMEKPLTLPAVELDLKKLLMLSSEGYDVNALIENAITSGWANIYRPGGRQQENPSRPVVYKSIEDVENESY